MKTAISIVVTLVIVLICVSNWGHSVRNVSPNAIPICASTPGGMFGYSIATTTQGNWTWLAIGQPWISTVSLYRTPFTQVVVTLVNVTSSSTTCFNGTTTYPLQPSSSVTSPVSTTTATVSVSPASSTIISSTTSTTDPSTGLNCITTSTTTQSVRFSANVTDPITWTLVTSISDPFELSSTNAAWNGSQQSAALPLFGYDVALSEDGTWLAVGTPGRSFVPFSQWGQQLLSWHPYHGSVVMYRINQTDSSPTVTYHSELGLNQLGRTQSYFDRFGSKIRFSPDTNPDRIYLFVSANGGWDHVSRPGALKPNGLPVVYGQDIGTAWPASPAWDNDNLGVGVFKYSSTTNAWQSVQFLPLQSRVPLGTIGIDFAVSGTGASDTVLVLRDYDWVGRQPIDVKDQSTGIVVVYRLNVNQFVLVAVIRGSNLGYTSHWTNEDWFGVGLSVAVAESNLAVLHIGVPRLGQVIRLVTRKLGIWDEWTVDGIRTNPATIIVPRHSFFGGTLVSSSTGRVVWASDAAGATGRGTVYMWHRRVPGIAVSGYEDVLRESTSSTKTTTTGNTNTTMDYDWIGTFNRPEGVTTTTGLYDADQFGKAVASSGNVVVVGAPVKDCVYTFPVPVAYPIPGWVSTVILPNNTITQNPTPTMPPGERVSDDKTVLYSVIGSVAGVLVFVPLAIYTAMRYHKKKLLAQLQAQAAGNTSPTSQALLTSGL